MVFQGEIKLSTQGFCDVEDITSRVDEIVKKSKIKEGIVVISVIGSTAGLTTIEAEPNLIEDFKDFWEKLIPRDKNYRHNQTWGDPDLCRDPDFGRDDNGFSHLRASLLGPSLSLIVREGQVFLGTWQQIVFVDFDNRPRERKIVVEVVGE